MRLLQLLPPQQRAVLVLRDVLGYRAREVADLLDTSEDATNGALRRARATLAASGGAPGELDVARLDPAGPDAALLDRFAQAFLSGDVSELVSLFTDDVWLRMPPLTLEYQGPLAAAAFFSAIGTHRSAVVRLVATSCNQQPAWGEYTLNPSGEVMHLAGVLVAGLRNGRICALTRFDIFSGAVIGLPRTIET
jgi:RNA polymerase sigma-70 factor (ECF subfamily)